MEPLILAAAFLCCTPTRMPHPDVAGSAIRRKAIALRREAIAHLARCGCKIVIDPAASPVRAISARLSGAGIGDAEVSCLALLPTLERVSLGGTSVTDAGMARLKGLKSLRALSLTANARITSVGLTYIEAMPGLTTLNLDHSAGITDRAARSIARLKRLVVLKLSGTRMTDAGLNCLCALGDLRELWLDQTQITDQGVAILARLPRLEVLSLDYCRITGTGFADAIPRVRGSIQSLGGCDPVHHARTPRRRWHSLRAVYLRGSALSAPGLRALASAADLRTLDISETGIARINALAKLANLTDFSAGDTGVDDVGMGVLRHLSNLRSIDLPNTRVTDRGLQELASLKAMRWLNLQHTAVTRAAVERLRSAVPQVMTDRDFFRPANGGLVVPSWGQSGVRNR